MVATKSLQFLANFEKPRFMLWNVNLSTATLSKMDFFKKLCDHLDYLHGKT